MSSLSSCSTRTPRAWRSVLRHHSTVSTRRRRGVRRRRLLDPRNRVLLAARAGGVLVGAVQIVRASAENGAHRAEIVRLAVRAEMRGLGVGRALLEAAVERARALGLSLLWLSTHADTDSDRIYERLGWTRMGTMPGYATRPDGAVVDNAFFYLEL